MLVSRHASSISDECWNGQIGWRGGAEMNFSPEEVKELRSYREKSCVGFLRTVHPFLNLWWEISWGPHTFGCESFRSQRKLPKWTSLVHLEWVMIMLSWNTDWVLESKETSCRPMCLGLSHCLHQTANMIECWYLRNGNSKDQMNERFCPEGCREIGEKRSLMLCVLPRVIWFRIGLVQVWKWG